MFNEFSWKIVSWKIVFWLINFYKFHNIPIAIISTDKTHVDTCGHQRWECIRHHRCSCTSPWGWNSCVADHSHSRAHRHIHWCLQERQSQKVVNCCLPCSVRWHLHNGDQQKQTFWILFKATDVYARKPQ